MLGINSNLCWMTFLNNILCFYHFLSVIHLFHLSIHLNILIGRLEIILRCFSVIILIYFDVIHFLAVHIFFHILMITWIVLVLLSCTLSHPFRSHYIILIKMIVRCLVSSHGSRVLIIRTQYGIFMMLF